MKSNVFLVFLFIALIGAVVTWAAFLGEISVDDMEYAALLQKQNSALAKQLENEMNAPMRQKDDFCAAWKAEVIALPIAGTAPKWSAELLDKAEKGNIEAQSRLGAVFLFGYGTTQSDQEAFKWFEKAAASGDKQAQGHLGTIYASGKGVSQDFVQAYFWLSLASVQGNSWAHKYCYEARGNLTPADLDKTNSNVLAWLKEKKLLQL
ncbi:MAG: tetratricopeptide repeat protein [Alphaproteobacteria bacterium]